MAREADFLMRPATLRRAWRSWTDGSMVLATPLLFLCLEATIWAHDARRAHRMRR